MTPSAGSAFAHHVLTDFRGVRCCHSKVEKRVLVVATRRNAGWAAMRRGTSHHRRRLSELRPGAH